MKLEPVFIRTGNDGYELSGYLGSPDETSTNEKAATLVIFLHDLPFGYSQEHDDFYDGLRIPFDDYGLQTLSFDFESYGESDGDEETFTLETARRNIEDVLYWARVRGFEKFLFVASGGAAPLALEAANDKTAMIFLFWPVLSFNPDDGDAGRLIYFEMEATQDGKDPATRAALIKDLRKYNPAALKKSVKLPVQIQYGAKDPTFDPANIDAIKECFNALRIDITSYADGKTGFPDPRHRDMAIQHVRQFLDKYA